MRDHIETIAPLVELVLVHFTSGSGQLDRSFPCRASEKVICSLPHTLPIRKRDPGSIWIGLISVKRFQSRSFVPVDLVEIPAN